MKNKDIFNKLIFKLNNSIDNSTLSKFTKEEGIRLLSIIESKSNNSLLNRSIKQYLCHKHLQGKLHFFILNIISFILLFPFLLFLTVYSIYNSIKRNKKPTVNDAAIFYLSDSLIPKSLKNRYNLIRVSNHYFCFNDLRYITKIMFKLKHYPFLCFKFITKISSYSYAINVLNVNAIICSSEYSFLSSALTDYCRFNNVKHINVMHGEKLFYIRDSFFEFDEMYVWDEYYINLFTILMAKKDQFIIEYPPIIKDIIIKNINIKENDFNVKYYLDGSETIDNIYQIRDILNKVFNSKVIFRPHPIYSNLNQLNALGITLENANIVNIADSIINCRSVCSKYSTVLYQASVIDKHIIIDDISNKETYNYLINSNYIMLQKPHTKLSELC